VPTVSATPYRALRRAAAPLLVVVALVVTGCAAAKGERSEASGCAPPVPLTPPAGAPFVWRNPLPQGDSLLSVWGAGPDDIWAVGDRGRALRYDGAAWHLADPGPTDYLAGVWGSGPDDVWVAGYNGRVLRFDGSRWWTLPTGVTNDFNGIWASGPKDVFAVGDRGVILHYDGTCWRSQATGTSDLFFGVSGTGPKDVWAVGGRGNVDHFDGAGWHPVDVSGAAPDAHFVGVWAAAPGEVYVVGTGGTVLHLHDRRWAREDAGTPALLRWVWGTGPTDVWVAGDEATVRHFDGAVWRGVDLGVAVPAATGPMGGEEHAVRGAWRSGPGGTTVLVGDDGLIVMGTGGALRPLRTGPVTDLYAVAGAWAAGTDGTLLFRDLEAGWHALPALGTDAFLALALLADGRVLAAGTGGVWLGDAHGWRRLQWPAGVPDRTVFALKAWDRRAVAVGDGGLVLAFDGERLAPLPAPGGEALVGVAGAGPDDFIAVGAAGAAYERSGGAWRAVPVAGGEDLMAVSDSRVAVGAMGGIYRLEPGAAGAGEPSGWRTLAPPGAFALNAVVDDPAGGTWAVGDVGAVRFIEGTQVRDVAAPTGRTLRGVAVAPDGRVTLVGDGGAVLERPRAPGGVETE
jgi:hypothetical protein